MMSRRWHWRRWPAAVAAICFFSLTVACGLLDPGSPPPAIHWQTLARGKALAAERHLPCLVDFFYGPGCQRCDRFINEIYSSPAVVARINSRFIPVRISLVTPLAAGEKALADEVESNGECMLMFLDYRGEVVKQKEGHSICSMEPMGVDEFTAMLDEAEKVLAEK